MLFEPCSRYQSEHLPMDLSKANTAMHRPRELLVPNPKLRLREQVREVMRFRHYSVRTEEAYWGWIRQFILFHDKKHPREMDDGQVEQFLAHPHRAGTFGAQRCDHDANLHARDAEAGHRGEKSAGWVKGERGECGRSQRSTSNVQRPTSNVQWPMAKVKRSMFKGAQSQRRR